jgi:hypothetical protein
VQTFYFLAEEEWTAERLAASPAVDVVIRAEGYGGAAADSRRGAGPARPPQAPTTARIAASMISSERSISAWEIVSGGATRHTQ